MSATLILDYEAVIGPRSGKETMFRVANASEQATAWHKEKPPL